jgi:Rieske Fe-S protein
MKEAEPSRRRALELILGGALAALGLPTRATASELRPAADVLVGRLDDLPPGAVKAAKYHGMPVLVLNVDGKVEVMSAICTHEGCTVTWDEEKKLILCPCHGGAYDRLGKVVAGPPPAPLIQLPVRVEGGRIYVVD